MPTPITDSMLYSLVTCPHGVAQDLLGNPAGRDPVSPFVQLLWERGVTHEQETMQGFVQPYVDLTIYAGAGPNRFLLSAAPRLADGSGPNE